MGGSCVVPFRNDGDRCFALREETLRLFEPGGGRAYKTVEFRKTVNVRGGIRRSVGREYQPTQTTPPQTTSPQTTSPQKWRKARAGVKSTRSTAFSPTQSSASGSEKD